MRYEDEREYFSREAQLMRDLRDLGAVDLEKPRRTMGFERRPERADQRPRAAAAWGYAPAEFDGRG